MMKEVARAIIINEEGQILLGQRSRGAEAGKWSFIGGKVEPGEDPIAAAIREVLEEIGLNFTPIAYEQPAESHLLPNDPWIVHTVFGKADGDVQLKAYEIAKIDFVGPDDLDKYEIAFDHADHLRKLFGI